MKTVVLILLVLLVGRFVMMSFGKISGEEAKRLVEGGALLVDVRTPGEFASGHLPGARNVPLDRLEAQAKDLGSPDRAIVVYCRSGGRSAAAASTLKRMGFHAVHDLGGLHRW